MFNFKKRSLTIKLMMFFIILATILFVAVGLLFFRSTQETINSSKKDELLTLSLETSNKIERYMFERYGDIEVMASSPLLKNNSIDKSLKEEYLDSVRKAYNAYDYIFITDANGNMDVFSGMIKGDENYKIFLPQVLKGQIYVSDFTYIKNLNSYIVYYAAPIFDRNNVIHGAVIERMNFNSIIDIVKNVRLGKTGYAYLVGNNGETILHSPSDFNEINIAKEQKQKTFYTEHNGIKYIASLYPVSKYDTNKNNWCVVVEEPVKEAFEVAYRLRNYTIIVVIILVFIVSVLALFMSKKITKPIKELLKETQSIAQGVIGQNINVDSSDEIGSLAESFNIVLSNLKFMMQQVLEISGEAASLKEIRQYADKFFENVPSAIITIDSSGEITTFNNVASDILGIEQQSIVGLNIRDTAFQSFMPIAKLMLEGLEKDIIYIKHITKIKSGLGIETPIMINTSAQKDIGGKILGVIAAFRSVEEIKQLEESVVRAKNLESLGVLSAGMAHEIRNPLTSIKGYAQYIKLELGTDNELNTDISIIISEVDRLNGIIDRFLTFARPRELNLELFNINEVLIAVLKLIEKEILQSNINVETKLGELPEIYLDYEQMEQVILNIIINAIDAMPNGGNLEIFTCFLETSGLVEIEICDNGEGILSESFNKIFEPFFTTKAKGTGLGLAICSRIIENHKGIIEVSSFLKTGTKFTIKLPITKEIKGE